MRSVNVELNVAIENGALARVRECLAREDDPDKLGFALRFGCQNGQVAAVGLILERFAKQTPPVASASLSEALAQAVSLRGDGAREKAVDLVKLLVDAGADVNAPAGPHEQPPLFGAATSYLPEVVEMLVELGADVNAVAPDGTSLVTVVPDWWGECADERGEIARSLRRRVDTKAVARNEGRRVTAAADLASQVADKLAAWARPALRPVTVSKPGDPTASRFGGRPYLRASETWPVCPTCNHPLSFLVQVNLGELAKAASTKPQRGLVQLFYCLTCEPYRPRAKEQLVRLIEPAGGGPAFAPKGTTLLPVRTVKSWKTVTDYPHPDEGQALWRKSKLKLGDDERVAAFKLNLQKDKALGWANWVQSRKPPPCQQCKGTTELLLQLDSNDHLNHTWGDNGVGFIFQCPKHPAKVTFTWECG